MLGNLRISLVRRAQFSVFTARGHVALRNLIIPNESLSVDVVDGVQFSVEEVFAPEVFPILHVYLILIDDAVTLSVNQG